MTFEWCFVLALVSCQDIYGNPFYIQHIDAVVTEWNGINNGLQIAHLLWSKQHSSLSQHGFQKWMNSTPGGIMVQFPCSLCACVSSLWALWLPPRIQRHVCLMKWWLKNVRICECGCLSFSLCWPCGELGPVSERKFSKLWVYPWTLRCLTLPWSFLFQNSWFQLVQSIWVSMPWVMCVHLHYKKPTLIKSDITIMATHNKKRSHHCSSKGEKE